MVCVAAAGAAARKPAEYAGYNGKEQWEECKEDKWDDIFCLGDVSIDGRHVLSLDVVHEIWNDCGDCRVVNVLGSEPQWVEIGRAHV